MAVTPADLLAPTGDLLPEFFPGEDGETITTRLEGYLTEGATEAAGVTDATQQDAAVRHFAYARAYGAIFVRLLHAPASVNVTDEVATTRLGAQITAFRTLREEHRARFDAIVATAAAPDATPPAVPVSDTTALGFTW